VVSGRCGSRERGPRLRIPQFAKAHQRGCWGRLAVWAQQGPALAQNGGRFATTQEGCGASSKLRFATQAQSGGVLWPKLLGFGADYQAIAFSTVQTAALGEVDSRWFWRRANITQDILREAKIGQLLENIGQQIADHVPILSGRLGHGPDVAGWSQGLSTTAEGWLQRSVRSGCALHFPRSVLRA